MPWTPGIRTEEAITHGERHAAASRPRPVATSWRTVPGYGRLHGGILVNFGLVVRAR